MYILSLADYKLFESRDHLWLFLISSSMSRKVFTHNGCYSIFWRNDEPDGLYARWDLLLKTLDKQASQHCKFDLKPPGTQQWEITYEKSIYFLKVYLFIFEREREHARASGGGAEKEGERKNPRQPLHCQHRAHVGLKLTNHEITTSAEVKSQTLNRLNHPAPRSPWKE